jgi:Spy/CpxP family protein refolding chaperone
MSMNRRHWGLATLALCAAAPMALAQQQGGSPDNIQIARERARKDKKAFVAEQLKLTDSQAKNFWPVYERYQKELGAIQQRQNMAAIDYVNASDKLTDMNAARILGLLAGADVDRAKLDQIYLKRFLKVIPGKQVARYYQIENKLRVAEEYDTARTYPLVN